MDFKQNLTNFSLKHYRLVTAIMIVAVLGLGSLITRIKVDTDPENMLSADEPVRLFHNLTKEQFNLNDIVVVGIVNNKNPAGVFNPALTTLRRPLRKMGREAARMVFDQLEGQTVENTFFTPELVMRESTRKIENMK